MALGVPILKHFRVISTYSNAPLPRCDLQNSTRISFGPLEGLIVAKILSQECKNNSTKCFVVVELLFYIHGKHLWSCWDGQLA